MHLLKLHAYCIEMKNEYLHVNQKKEEKEGKPIKIYH
jgi:hypothetical protein